MNERLDVPMYKQKANPYGYATVHHLDNSSPATIHHLRQFITCDNSSPATIHHLDNSSPATIHHLRQFITHKEKGPIFRKI
ncbi:hypothetical protein DdX_10314 [Ditylenchus destructor]|uniref:Uncharacterized protein n=1 Tax=Ditylenchus destructor TaxID=166010 RepID=A0AAD4R281_9BILA|nr:hypothetical protein DdX_10314 [Ditylenchus destructor]